MISARKVLWMFAPALAVGASVPAWSQDRAAVRSLVAACFTCHGTDGRSVGGVPPAIAGLDRQYLLQTLKDFKAGKRPATIMHQQAKGYTDQELEIMAGYFASVKPAAPPARY
jgi:cytochrome c553